MNFINCERCGRICQRNARNLCASCREQDEEAFQLVKSYLQEHPETFLYEIEEAIEVPTSWVTEMIRDGRLELSNNPNMWIECRRCHTPIQTGSHCDKCAQEFNSEINAIRKQTPAAQPANRQRTNGGYVSRGMNEAWR